MKRIKPFSAANLNQYTPVIGVDEAGRGALCSAVVVAAVWFDPQKIDISLLESLDDSKRLSPKKRKELCELICGTMKVGIAASSAKAIDQHNIRAMTLDAMRRAVLKLNINAPVKIDGIDIPPGLSLDCEAVEKADGKIPQVAAASIVAKTIRDRLVKELLANKYPHFGWDRNGGYGTAEHMDGLRQHGASEHHRKTFGGVISPPSLFDF